MNVLVVANAKGGSGKTTTAVHLAGLLPSPVLLVDADPQGSATWWGERAGLEVVQETDPALLGRIPQLQGYRWVVVDTPPALSSKGLESVSRVADHLVLPSPPSPLDLVALRATVQRLIAPSGARYKVLLTRVHPRSIGEAEQLAAELREAGIPVFARLIRAYKVYERAALEGKLVWQLQKGGVAGSDYRAVVAELKEGCREPQTTV